MKNPYPINPILQFVVKVWMTILTKRYNISAQIDDEVKNLDEPYLLIGNHVGRYDPFIQSHFIKKRPNFISSDAILRDRVIGSIFKWLGAMPKKKGVRDSYIIREMIKVVKSGGALGLYPEGARTWSGKGLDIDPSLAKLVKMLRLPVITVKMKGAYAFDPRWAAKIRKAKVELEYTYAFRKEELKALSEEEILAKINSLVNHNDIAYIQENKIVIDSDARAEAINRVLFECPSCDDMSYFKSHKNAFSCLSCNTEAEIDPHGFFDFAGQTNTKDWIEWQEKKFVTYLSNQLIKAQSAEPLLRTQKMSVEKAIGKARMEKIGIGFLELYNDRLELKLENEMVVFKPEVINELSPQFKERLEMMLDDEAYRLTSLDIFEPGIKWELAMNALWKYTGHDTRLSPYYKHLFQ